MGGDGDPTQALWSAVDAYATGLLAPEDAALREALADAEAAGLPAHHLSAAQGRLLQLLARIAGAGSALELGTLAAYSTIWLARGLPPDGRLVTIEADPRYAAVARSNLERAGLSAKVELRVGAALDVLPLLADRGERFDLIFIDADKANNAAYLPLVLDLANPGAVILADNVVRAGALADAGSEDPKVRGQRRLHELIAAEPSLTATTIQTVGDKGYDGFTICNFSPG